jgi:hypothetical protein
MCLRGCISIVPAVFVTGCDLHWVTAGSTPGDAWLQIEWVGDQTLWGMQVDTNQYENTACWDLGGATLAGGTIQIRSGSDWVDHGTVSGRSDDWSYVFDQPFTTSRVRIYGAHAGDLGGQTENPLVYEWEVFGCG